MPRSDAARGVLAVARAVLAQIPDLTPTELADKIAGGLGAKRADVREILFSSDLFAPPPADDDDEEEPAETAPLPRYIVQIDGSRKHAPPFVVISTDPPREVIRFERGLDAQMYCDGLNLELTPVQAMDRSIALDQLLHGGGGTVRFDGPIATLPSQRTTAFVCDLLDQQRAWGPFPTIAEAHAWRQQNRQLSAWAVTTYFPFSRYYPPALYGLFRREHPLRMRYPNPWLNPPREAPKKPEIRADDMTPVILEAARQYMAFQTERDRSYGPCAVAYERLRKLMLAGGAGA